MGLFDLLTVAVAIVCYAIGRSRGLVWQLSGIATLIGGGLCATVLSRPLGPVFAEGIVGRFVAWIVLYAVIAICLYAITLSLRNRIKELEYEELDKRFGGMLGAFKGLMIYAVIVLVAVSLSEGIGGVVKKSASGQALKFLVNQLRILVPERIHDAFGPYLPPLDEAPSPVTDDVEDVQARTTPTPAAPSPTPAPTQRPNPFESPPRVERPQPSATPAPSVTRNLPLPVEDEPEEEVYVPPAEPVFDTLPDPFDTSDDPKDPLAPEKGK